MGEAAPVLALRADGPAVIEARGLSKAFGGVQALREVGLAARAGEVLALLGENGAGKSTLIKIITGFHQPDAGELLLDGRPVRFAGTRDALDQGVAAIYQEPSLFPDLDIAENIFVGRQPLRGGRIDWRRMYEEAEALLRRLGVRLNPRTRARALSVAQMQMVEIARAISVNARVLIMDEPTSSLTSREVEELFTIVRQLKAQGAAIVFISHRLEELFAIADRVTVLRDGAYVDTRAMAGVTTEDLIRMMVGRNLAELFPKQQVEPGEVLLEVRDLGLPGRFADISFQLRRGEILGMAGLVGAGRTEVAEAIFGVAPTASGQILLDGREARIERPEDALRLGIGYVPEDRKLNGLVLPMSIAQNITLPILGAFTRMGWLDRRAERERSIADARRLEVKMASVDQPVGQLSGGNQQKVVLAKWLGTSPRVLILDEPTRGIDVGTKAAVHRLMSQLAAEGMAILMISSELPEVLGMSDRILVMREGRLTGQFSRAEATQERLMGAATAAVARV
ncbi:MAG TPA: sugar ABC transporter ATP-binding protein [Chloroflexaceae bacterium]|nr:sugar ABC transporter ATP-binding protein [Chloroflexaceae bacterium]